MSGSALLALVIEVNSLTYVLLIYDLLTMLKAKETFSFWVRVFLFEFTTSEINILFPFVITRTTLKGVFNQEFVSQVWQALSLFFF